MLDFLGERDDRALLLAPVGPAEEDRVILLRGEAAIPGLLLGRDDGADVRQIARPQTAGDCELHDLVELLGFPERLEPFQRHGRQAATRLATATALAEDNLGQWFAAGAQPRPVCVGKR